MKEYLFVDTIQEIVYSNALLNPIKNQIECSKNNYTRKGLNVVVGRTFYNDLVVYFIYNIEEGLNQTNLENFVDIHIQNMWISTN